MCAGSTCEQRGYVSHAPTISERAHWEDWEHATWEDCSTLCSEDSTCTHWNYKPATKYCMLKSGDFPSTPVAQADWMVGPAGCGLTTTTTTATGTTTFTSTTAPKTSKNKINLYQPNNLI